MGHLETYWSGIYHRTPTIIIKQGINLSCNQEDPIQSESWYVTYSGPEIPESIRKYLWKQCPCHNRHMK